MSNEKKQDLAAYIQSINPQSDYGAWIGDIFIGIGLGVLTCIINIFFVDVMCGGEVSDLFSLLFAVVWPIILMIVWPLWHMIMEKISVKRVRTGLELCIEHATTNEQLMESDRYLLILLRRNALSRKQQEQIRDLRNLCCDEKGYHPSQFSGYRQALYDADPAFADERNFKVLWNDAKDASRKTASKDGSCKAASAESAATSRKNTASAARAASTAAATGFAAGSTGVLGSSGLSSYDDDLDDDDSIALDMEEAIDDDIMFHGGNPFDWDTRSDYLDDPFGFGDDDGFGGDGDEW